MNTLRFLLILTITFMSAGSTFGQLSQMIDNDDHLDNFKVYAEIYLDEESMVKSDTPDGPLTIGKDEIGNLSVYVIDRSGGHSKVKESIPFKIAVENGRTGAFWLFSDKSFTTIDLRKILIHCEWGDKIMVMTMGQDYQLARHEIRVSLMDGC